MVVDAGVVVLVSGELFTVSCVVGRDVAAVRAAVVGALPPGDDVQPAPTSPDRRSAATGHRVLPTRATLETPSPTTVSDEAATIALLEPRVNAGRTDDGAAMSLDHAWVAQSGRDRTKGRRMGARQLSGFVVVGALAVWSAAAVSGSAAATPPNGGDAAALTAELQQATSGKARLAYSNDTGAATFAGGTEAMPLAAARAGTPAQIARGFVDRYGPLFGVADPQSDLTELQVFKSVTNTAIRYQQRYRGIPVLAGELAVQVAPNGSVLSTTGEAEPALSLDVAASVPASAATDTARAIAVKYDGADAATLTTTVPELWIYDPSLIGADGPPGARLVWRLEVRTTLGDVDRLVLIDAHTGAVALQFSQVEQAKNRRVCDNANVPSSTVTCNPPGARSEGDPPTGNSDVDSAFDLSGATYDFYMNSFGRDSVDNAGLQLKSTVRYCPNTGCPYNNAFWNGSQMVYGEGFAVADDVVGHELTHGVTQYTSGLLYYADSGAINESMSDVMGELIDLANGSDPAGDRWKVGEALSVGPIRDMSDPPVFSDPDRVQSALFAGDASDSHGVHTNSGVNNKAAFLITDGATFNGQTITGLGTDKTAQIYYQAETTLLTPGSDYRDLYNILPQACLNLVGTHGIVAGDCQQVTKAVTATEMNLFPTTTGAHLTAPVCDGGTTQADMLFSDDMENPGSGNWATGTSGVGQPWNYTTNSSQSGVRSVFTADPSFIGLSALMKTTPIALPSGTTYLRFDHSYEMDYNTSSPVYYDGGVVEYSTDGGSSWQDAGALPIVNGYNGALASLFGNPLGGRSAFSGPSPGYETTRIDLSSLAGQNVRIRFVLGSDNSFAYPGWFIDDLSVYTCAVLPSAPSNVVAASRDAAAALSWTAPNDDGGSAIRSYTITPYINGVAQTPVSTGTNATSFKVTGLANGTSYTFTVAAQNGAGTGPASSQSNAIIPVPSLVSLVPARLLESRSGLSTVDGGFNGIGLRPAGAETAVTVLNRGGVAPDATAVVLNVTITEAQAPGFVTVYPCGGARPTASNLNYKAGSTVANAVVAKVGSNGQVCVFNQSATHLVIDVNGYFAAGATFVSLVPARLLESRSGLSTTDGAFNDIGLRPAGAETALTVTNRGGVAADAVAVVLNVTVTEAQAAGFVTVYPCGSPRPTASNLNVGVGGTVPNAVVAKVGSNGQVCIFNQSATHLIVDVNGYFPAGSTFVSLVPARLLESRPNLSTVDGNFNAIGTRPAQTVTAVTVAGRGGVAPDAVAAVLNVTVTQAQAAGFVTVFPCGSARPTASSLNVDAGGTVANAVVAKIGDNGQVCIFNQSPTELVVDVNGYFP